MDFFSIKIQSFKARILYMIIIMTSFVLVFTLSSPNEDYPIYISELDIQQMMLKSQGEGITIAFLDSGMNEHLQVLYGNRVVSPIDLVTNSEFVTDSNGHGTSMICIATCDYSQTGIFGIAPKSSIMPIRIFDNMGKTSPNMISQAIRYAVNHEANIINLSFGSYENSPLVENAIDYAYSKNVFVVSSAGNNINRAIAFPARYHYSLSIGEMELIDKFNLDKELIGIDYFLFGEDIPTMKYSIDESKFIIHNVSGSSVSTAIMSSILALKLSKMNDGERVEFFFEIMDNTGN